MNKRVSLIILLVTSFLIPQSAQAWDAVGHQVVARIAWENMTPTARRNVVNLLREAPRDACLRNLFPNNSQPLSVRQRQFFMLASTWPDIVRPGRNDTRPCTRFHQRDWHFINFFWSGVSGDAPQDVTSIPTPLINAVERLGVFRSSVNGGGQASDRATQLAWILHLVGDIHQPLHTSARVTTEAGESRGDQGGNLFKLGPGENALSLHSYWDGIIGRSIRRRRNEGDFAYLDRVAGRIMADHPRASLIGRLRPLQFDAWAREGFDTTKRAVYPSSLERGQMPSENYRRNAFTIADEAIAIGGYRLADMMNQLFGS
ncbi:MAG TPA: S1/P1 nuclease [Pyrinomonadaceae bacterium]|jgi:hypothetical protein